MALLVAGLCGTAVQAQAPQRIRLTPQFTAGQTVRYQMDVHTEKESFTAGALENPQAPKKVELSVSAMIRIEVLRAEAGSAGAGKRYRLRGTYEKLVSTTRSDVDDPSLAENESQLRKLEGRWQEFTLGPDGKVSEVIGLEDLFPEQGSAVAGWLAQFNFGVSMPAEGIAPGQSWPAAERAITSAPLVGTVWRGQSTYLRNEPCRTTVLTPPGELKSADTAEMCAVILTRSQVTQRDAAQDPTPEDFRRRGLRVAGKYNGTGENLTYVSLATGLVVSTTETMTEELDLRVTDTQEGTTVRYRGSARSQSSIAMVKK